MTRATRLLFAVFLGYACTACRPSLPSDAKTELTVPDVPEIADAGLRKQLFTLRAIVIEHNKLSAPNSARDNKTSIRLGMLQQGFAELEKQCLANPDVAGESKKAVQEFIDHCNSAMRSL